MTLGEMLKEKRMEWGLTQVEISQKFSFFVSGKKGNFNKAP